LFNKFPPTIKSSDHDIKVFKPALKQYQLSHLYSVQEFASIRQLQLLLNMYVRMAMVPWFILSAPTVNSYLPYIHIYIYIYLFLKQCMELWHVLHSVTFFLHSVT